MAHPYSDQAKSTHKSKTGSMGKGGNLDIPIMRAVGENKKGGVHESSASMQHKNQSSADGMKRGGHVGKPKHGKPKVVLAPPVADAAPDPAMAAGAAPPMPPGGAMPPPGQPPMKRGGAAFARGGKVPMSASADNGMGRKQKIKAYGLKPIKG